MNNLIIIILIALSVIVPNNIAATQKAIYLKDGTMGILYYPQQYDSNKSYPLLIALHGMKQAPLEAIIKWRKIADHFGYILLCPEGSNFNEGYIRKPVDDRKKILGFFKKMTSDHNIDAKNSILAGFSRGGNFAIETGLLYPETFKNIICLFGFFNKGIERIPKYKISANSNTYQDSSFYFISGNQDMTMNSLIFGRNTLRSLGVKSRLWIYDDLYHEYPNDFIERIEKIRTWFDK